MSVCAENDSLVRALWLDGKRLRDAYVDIDKWSGQAGVERPAVLRLHLGT